MSEPTSISVDFKFDLKDYLEAQRLLRGQTFAGKADKIVASLMAGFGVYNTVTLGFYWWTAVFFIAPLLIWFDLLPLRKWATRIALSRNPQFQQEYHVTISSENIDFKSATFESVVQWTYYKSVIEGQEVFLLIYGKNLYTLIPKRAFHSKEDMDTFRALHQKMLPSPQVPPLALP